MPVSMTATTTPPDPPWVMSHAGGRLAPPVATADFEPLPLSSVPVNVAVGSNRFHCQPA